MKAQTIMRRPPVEWGKTVNRMKTDDRRELARELEEISRRAAMLAEYLNERYGYGCGDQGHKKGVKSANKAGQKVWCGAFGYNAHHDFSF
jgi:hypothetical protein